MEEDWKPIVGFASYEVSGLGRVRSARLGRVLTGTLAKRGYLQVNLRGPNGRRTRFVHRLVAAAFLGPAPAGHFISHRSGNRLDNRASNLEWVPRAGDVRRVVRMLGEANPNAKLTENQVREMRLLRQQGMSLAELGQRFGVTERAAHRVTTRRDWKHIE